MDSLVPKFNMETEEENGFITFSDGTKVYYEKTDELNYTEIEIPVKRHNRHKYAQAVKSQLLYFKNVKFTRISENGFDYDEEFKAEILFESENLIVSNNYQFSKPHIIITKGEGKDQVGVCYGYVDFLEMEMEQLYGNIGIKCPIQSLTRDDITGVETILEPGVEVTPSRESVVWSEHTRKFLKERFEAAVEDATKMIQEKLDSTDLIDWINATKTAMNGGGSDNKALTELYKIIDKGSISPVFPGTSIKFANPVPFFRGMKARLITTEWDRQLKKSVTKRVQLENWSSWSTDNIFIKTDKTSIVKDKYIREMVGGDFITIELQSDEERFSNYQENDVKSKNLSPAYFVVAMKMADDIYTQLVSSKHSRNYEDIEVPEDFGKAVEVEQEEDKKVLMSAAERRKLNGKITYQFANPNSRYGNSWGTDKDKPFYFSNHEVKISELEDWEGTVIYGTNDELDYLIMVGLMFMGSTTKCDEDGKYNRYENSDYRFNNVNLRIIKVSKQNERYFKSNDAFWHINDFIQTVRDYNG